MRYSKLCPHTKPGRFVGINKLTLAHLVYFESENKIRPCVHTIPIQENGTQGAGDRVHNVSLETSVDPNTVHSYVDGRLAPPRTVIPVVELPG